MNESVTVCSRQQVTPYHHSHGTMPSQCSSECVATEPQAAAVAGSWTAYGHQPVTTAAAYHHHHHLQQQHQQQDHHLHHPHGMPVPPPAPQPLLHHHHHHQPADGNGGYAGWPAVVYNKRRPSYADDVQVYHHHSHHAPPPPPPAPPHHQTTGPAATLQAVAAYNPAATSTATATCSSPGTSLDEPSSAAVASYQTTNDYKYWPTVQHQPSPTGTGRVSPYGWMKRVEYQDRPQPGA